MLHILLASLVSCATSIPVENLIPEQPYTVEGRLTLSAEGGRMRLFLVDLSKTYVYYRPTGQQHPPLETVRFPRIELDCPQWEDTAAIARMVGSKERVRASGRFGVLPDIELQHERLGLKGSTLSLRGVTIPTMIPTIWRLHAMARAAVQDWVASHAQGAAVTDLVTHYAGAFLVDVSLTLGNAAPRRIVYDGLTGEIEFPR